MALQTGMLHVVTSGPRGAVVAFASRFFALFFWVQPKFSTRDGAAGAGAGAGRSRRSKDLADEQSKQQAAAGGGAATPESSVELPVKVTQETGSRQSAVG